MEQLFLVLPLLLLFGCWDSVQAIATAGPEVEDDVDADTDADAEAEAEALYVAYFRHHGVQSLVLIDCGGDENGTDSSQALAVGGGDGCDDTDSYRRHKEVLALTRYLITHGFYVRVFIGRDDASAPLLLRPLSHKSGVLLLQFGTACARRILRWSAAPERNYFTTNRFWLLAGGGAAAAHVARLGDVFLPPDGEVRLMVRPCGEAAVTLIDVYRVSVDRPLQQRLVGEALVGVAALQSALQRFGSAISYREDLQGVRFETGLVIAFPDMFTHIEDLSLRHIDTISKVNNRLTIELANKLNLRFNTHQTDNYGWRQPNGTFDGLMGRFERYELDFAQNAIFMRLDRIALVDFVAETFRIRAGLMFRQPPLSAVANIFAMPFSSAVWLSIVALMVFTVLVLGLELLFSPHAHAMDLLDCMVFVWGAMCQQGFHVTIANRSARIIVFSTFMVTLFLYTSFSANIVALLQSPSEAIHSLSDLSQSPLEIGVQDTVYNKIYFNESTDPITNRLYRKKIAPKGDTIFMRPLVGMEKMRTGLFAYQVELQAGYQIISDTFSEPEKCGLMELEPFQLPMIAIPTRKNFPYKELFRRQLRWQREVGLMNREERKWFPQKPKCEGGVSGFVSIGLTECRYALGMFGFGALLAVIMLGVELLTMGLVGVVQRSKWQLTRPKKRTLSGLPLTTRLSHY